MKKKMFLAVAMTAVLAAPAWSGKENYGKADDYGSERFRAINQCMIGVTLKTDRSLSDCMDGRDFAFCPNCQVFGNSGGRCKNDRDGKLHSWCWIPKPVGWVCVLGKLGVTYERQVGGTQNKRDAECD
jgi:hypothetical protein